MSIKYVWDYCDKCKNIITKMFKFATITNNEFTENKPDVSVKTNKNYFILNDGITNFFKNIFNINYDDMSIVFTNKNYLIIHLYYLKNIVNI